MVNDNDRGSQELKIEYVGENWGYTLDSECYMEDNSWSKTVGEYILFPFTGTSLKYYATKAPNHGIAAFSIDDGPEQMVDYYQANRQSQLLLYDSGTLEAGHHVLKVRVTGEKNPASSDVYVTADRIEVYEQLEAKKLVRDIFKDVNAGDWFEESVQYLYDRGIMTGMDADYFGSAVPLNRSAQFVWKENRKQSIRTVFGWKEF